MPDAPPSLKRNPADTESPEQKKAKATGDCPHTVPSGLPADFFSQTKPAEAKSVSSRETSHGSLLIDYEDDKEEEEEGEGTEGKELSSKPPLSPSAPSTTTSAPLQKAAADPLENKTAAAPAPLVSHSGSIQKAEVQEKIVERRENTAEALPEGFFDDPEVDAKASVTFFGYFRAC
ncbi:UNVERIFIED_CONTAM: hypothetical protein K2H54_055433 [Gekko kuhli]